MDIALFGIVPLAYQVYSYLKRLRGIDLLMYRLSKFASPASIQHGRQFSPKKDDIFIVTYPKCGTTWLQQICHVLRTGGEEAYQNFDEITCVVPWTITAFDCGQNLNDEQVASPRLFKSHEDFYKVPKGVEGAKYIYCVRDPSKILVSFYHFLLDYCKIPPTPEHAIHIDDFASKLLLGQGSGSGKVWEHFVSWFPSIHSPNVLWLCYEHLVENPSAIITKIAQFMNISLSPQLLNKTLKLSSFDHMVSHKTQFDDHLVFNAMKGIMGLSENEKITVGKVRKKPNSSSKKEEKEQNPLCVPSPHILDQMEQRWKSSIHQTIGFESYQELKDFVWDELNIKQDEEEDEEEKEI